MQASQLSANKKGKRQKSASSAAIGLFYQPGFLPRAGFIIISFMGNGIR